MHKVYAMASEVLHFFEQRESEKQRLEVLLLVRTFYYGDMTGNHHLLR